MTRIGVIHVPLGYYTNRDKRNTGREDPKPTTEETFTVKKVVGVLVTMIPVLRTHLIVNLPFFLFEP